MRKRFVIFAALLGLAPFAAQAQEDYPRAAYIGPLRTETGNQGISHDDPPKEECWKRPCLVIVNATSLTRIVEFRLNSGEHDKHGQLKWSPNLLGGGVDAVFPKNFLWWYKPDKMSCDVTVKLVIREYSLHPDERTGSFNLCGASGPGIFVLRDEPLAAAPAKPATP